MIYDNKMELPKGKTCNDCVFVARCCAMFGVKKTNTSCDWSPVRFKEKQVKDETKGTP
jgi:hypothetical protein